MRDISIWDRFITGNVFVSKQVRRRSILDHFRLSLERDLDRLAFGIGESASLRVGGPVLSCDKESARDPCTLPPPSSPGPGAP